MSQDPSSKWKKGVDEHAKICKSILNISDSIRYVGALNKYGRTLAGFIRPGTQPMLAREQAKNEFFVLSTVINLSRDAEEYVGKMEHILIRHEKVKMALIPTESMAYIVTIDGKTEEYMDIVNSAKKIING